MTQVSFTASGTWVVPAGVSVLDKLLKVSGGGSGGKSARGGGGGGGGGIVEDTAVTVVPGETLTITIGAGGTAPGTALTAGGNGGVTSVVGSVSGTLGTSPAGGGGGGGVSNVAGNTGGSGGGGSGGTSGNTQAGGTASPAGQGQAGGAGRSNSITNARSGGGGGGKGATGGAAVSGEGAGNGGSGSNYSATYGTGLGAAGWFGGGGGGGRTSSVSGTIASGGTGGGGAGGNANNLSQGVNGTANTGGGGGGSGTTGTGGAGTDGTPGAGGSGAVVLTYTPVAAPNVPTSVAASNVSYTSADLSWSAPSGGGTVTSYEVRADGGAASTATSPHTFTGLTSGSPHDLEVRAVGPGGNSAWVLVSIDTLELPPYWYRVDLTVGAHTYSVEKGETPDYGVRLPLTLGWALPDSVEYFPCQADPTKMTFGLLVADASELSDVVRGATVTFAMYVDPDPGADPWQSFSGIVTQLDGVVTDAGNFRVTVYAGDDTLRLADMVIGYSGAWPEESIEDRIDRIVAEAGLTVTWLFYNGGAEGTLAGRNGSTTVLAAIRDSLKDVASDNTSEPPDEWWGRYTYSYDPSTSEVTIQPFERRVYDGSTLTVDGDLVSAWGDWSKLPGAGSTATWVLVDGVTFGTPSGPPLVRNTNLVDTTPTNPSAVTRDNLGESLLPDASTQLEGWYTDKITVTSYVDPTPMGAGLVHAEGLASFAPMRVVVPVVVTPLDPDHELNGVDYLAGTLTGAQLVLPPGGLHRVSVRLRPELLPGTDLP